VLPSGVAVLTTHLGARWPQAETARREPVAISGSTSLRASRTGDSMESSRQEIVPEPILAFKTSIWCSKTVLNPIQNFISKFS
jgi:hypothetical protein